LAVAGARRSGHHAVLSWAISDWQGVTLALNACQVRGGKTVHYGGYVYVNGRCHVSLKNLTDIPQHDRLVITIEDMSYEAAVKTLHRWQPKHSIMVLRDPFNAFASQIRRWPEIRLNADRWMTWARAYLDGRLPRPSGEWVDYDRWVEYNRDCLPSIHPAGHGSSFDGQGGSDVAARMDVIGRWRRMKHNAEWKRAALDAGVICAAKRIWPSLTEEIINGQTDCSCHGRNA
jgi:hypothetical protein